jgi:hypothetical protein
MGDKLKIVLAKFPHFKLDSFALPKEVYVINTCPYLKLKTQPRFLPACLSVSLLPFEWGTMRWSANIDSTLASK